jgi:hypothetical protein
VRKKLLPLLPSTDEEWEEKARALGVESGAVLKEQTKLADEILLEIVEEENRERAKK